MAAQLTDLTAVKQRLNINAAITTWDVELQLIIDATDERICEYCNRNFTFQEYTQSEFGYGSSEILLSNWPISNILFAATGRTGVMTVDFAGTSLGSIEVEINDNDSTYEIRFTEDMVVTGIVTLALTGNISDVATAITALPNWTATVQQDTGTYPARSVLPNFYSNIEQNDQICIFAPTGFLNLAAIQRSKGEYNADRTIGTAEQFTIIYKGGYETIPDALKDAATQISADTFKYGKTASSGLSSEKIGNYAWTAGVKSFIAEILPSWYSVLTNFKNPSMA